MKRLRRQTQTSRSFASELTATGHPIAARRKKSVSDNSKVVFAVLLTIVVTLSVGKLIIANHYATKGSDLAQVEAEKEQLQEENDMLQTKLATITSLSYIEQQAKAEGFKDAATVVYVPAAETPPPLALDTSGLQ